ncbi:MAG: hypothetical protein A2166_02920 [Omnitrophica WOR_2 bacterium RBG_13_41_10]|nr:MAG: hypothetical protein A2166_02920 [Omnitrophica WOR_2 bacterium RBG_13_41_10]
MINLIHQSRNLIKTWNTLELDSKKVILIALVCAVIIYLDFAFLIKMQFQAVGNINTKIITLKKDMDNLNKNLVLMQQSQNKPTTIKKIKKMISEGQIPLLFQKISDIANKYNVKIQELKPAKDTKEAKTKGSTPAQKSDLNATLLTLNALSGYHELGGFLSELENADEFIAVENLKIIPQKEGFKHSVKILLKTYVSK